MIALILLTSVLVTAYLYVTRNFDYWKKRGVYYLKPKPFVGNLGSVLTKRKAIGDFITDIYNDHKDLPYVGVFLCDSPCLVVRDFELISRIFKQDFHYFNKRILTMSKKTDPIGARSLFTMHGKEWKNTRNKLSPIFTSKKQRVVFDDMIGVGKKLQNILDSRSTLELKEMAASFTVDMISDAVLGFDGKALDSPKTDEMMVFSEMLFSEAPIQSTRQNLLFLVPELMDALRIRVFSKEMYDTMISAVKKALELKQNDNIHRGDYIDALLELQTKGSWEGNDGEIIEPNESNMVSMLFMFFTAGFETAGSGLTYTLYELAKNPNIQDKIRDEFRETMKKHNGVISYEVINEMNYMNNYISECLRLHPPFPYVDRICSADYNIPGTDIVINKGVKVMIPMMGIHRDEKYYENPMKLIPERFDDPEAMKDKPYFPFSTGPRQCLGMRFAQQLLRICVIYCVRDHRLFVIKETPGKIVLHPGRFGNTPKDDVIIGIERL